MPKILKMMVGLLILLLIAAYGLYFYYNRFNRSSVSSLTRKESEPQIVLGDPYHGPLSGAAEGISGVFIKVENGRILLNVGENSREFPIDEEIVYVCTSADLENKTQLEPWEVKSALSIQSNSLNDRLRANEPVLVMTENRSEISFKINSVASSGCE